VATVIARFDLLCHLRAWQFSGSSSSQLRQVAQRQLSIAQPRREVRQPSLPSGVSAGIEASTIASATTLA